MTERERPARHRRCCEASDGSRRGRGQGALLEPLVLSVLARADAHGYDIVREIGERTGGAVTADLGGVYRVLRRLDDAGVVTSAWAEGDVGPARREYRLTEDGRELLAHWQMHLNDRMNALRTVTDVVSAALHDERSDS